MVRDAERAAPVVAQVEQVAALVPPVPRLRLTRAQTATMLKPQPTKPRPSRPSDASRIKTAAG